MKRYYLILLGFTFFTSCATATNNLMECIMSSWTGSNVNEVIKSWGYPDEEKTIAGKHLYIWTRELTVNNLAVQKWNCTRTFEVNPENIVIGWQWEGNNCPFAEAGAYKTWRKTR